MQPKYWGAQDAEPGQLVNGHLGHFVGHHHGYAALSRGLLEYTVVSHDQQLKDFVRSGYEYARGRGIPRIGLAARLSDAGIGDYWEDVDRYVRNDLFHQLQDPDLMKLVGDASPEHHTAPPQQTDERVIKRGIGTFAGDFNNPTKLTNTWVIQCCTGRDAVALLRVGGHRPLRGRLRSGAGETAPEPGVALARRPLIPAVRGQGRPK